MTATLYVAISSHGFGHIAQTAPVLNELHRRDPGLRFVVECGAARDVLARRLRMPFEHVQAATDFGMVMRNAFEVDVEASHARYLEVHAGLPSLVEAASRRLRDSDADVLLADISYVPLIAASRLGIPSVALCSLNWAAIYGGMCEGRPGADGVLDDMMAAYRTADCFLAPSPSMDMHGLANMRAIGPIAESGRNVRSRLCDEMGLAQGTRLVTVTMGGIETDLPFDRWPHVDGVTWIVPDDAQARRGDMVWHSDLGLPFLDVLTSSDALITKPGYGAFAEAACNGVPVLYVPRANWPEAPFLVRWLEANGHCAAISGDDLHTDRLGEALHALWRRTKPAPVSATGIVEAADAIQRELFRFGRSSAIEVAR